MQAAHKGEIHPSINPKNRRPDWSVILGIGALHLGCLAAPWTFSWSGLVIMLALIWIGAGWGITLCYHRLLTHRSFQTPKWFEYFLCILATLNWQGGPITWVGTHRLHHRDSDQPGDPHSPYHGFIWSHITWTLFKSHPDFNPREAAKDLERDPFINWLDRYFFFPQFVLAAVLYGVGYLVGGHTLAISWLVWGIALRTVFVYHGTWFVNSASHVFGYRNFETTDDSRNNWWVAFLSFGEGWHNNHHAFQRSAAHGLKWWEIDLTYMTIKLMAKVGLATKIVVPQEEIPQSAFIKPGKHTANVALRSGGNVRTLERTLEQARQPLFFRIMRFFAVWS